MAFQELLGDVLLTKDGEKPTSEVMAGVQAVGLYFSAHWCPPCRGFTPKLAEWYTTSLKAKGLEIVFVTGDHDATQFQSYFGEQPWTALPYEKQDINKALNKKFKVRGIPSFVILDAEGKTITTEGREAVSSDPTGLKFPWTPPTKEEKQASVLAALGDLVQQAGGKPIGLYFSAHWCPPCKAFTPKLAEWYKDGLKDKMEIIFVSSDRDQAAFDEYFGEMPWLALPYDKRSEKEDLSKAFGISGIPSFVVINPDGSLITEEGRSMVSSDPKGETLPEGWLPQPCNNVNDNPSDLNEEQCILAVGNDEAMYAAVKEVAKEYYEKAGKDASSMPIRFFIAPDGVVTDQIRKLTKVEGNKLIFLDIPSDGAFYVCEESSPDVAQLKSFISVVLAGNGDRKQLGS